MPDLPTTTDQHNDAPDELGSTRQPIQTPECPECRRVGTVASGDFWDPDPKIHQYSYRPVWQFRGAGPMYYGMEIEVCTYDAYSSSRIVHSYLDPHHLGFLKEDGSVDGFEIVTDPMSYPWAMEHFPWQMLAALDRDGCAINPDENGIHIHVSRSGFSSDAHTYRWMKLLYRNAGEVRRIARRDSAWGTFGHRDCQRDQYMHVLSMKKDPDHVRRGTDKDATLRSRYNAINTTNRDTLEVRAFASTLRPEQAKQALQLVAGSVEYTGAISSKEVVAGAWRWPEFAAWVTDHAATYPQLAEVV